MDGPGITTADLEGVERDASADFWAAAPAGLADAFGIAHRRVGDGVLLLAAGLRGSMAFNRLLGYGVTLATRGDELDAAIAELERAGGGSWVVQVAPDAGALSALAAARGLEPHPRPWVKFARGADPDAAVAGDLEIRPAGAKDATAFGATFCQSFGIDGAVAPWAAALPGRERWDCFVAWDGALPVGVGALYRGDGLGWIGFGGTLASHRGRGCQRAMLAARIEAGRAAGCRGFVTETGAPLPGEPGPSFRNIGRAGFREVYRRPNLCPPPRSTLSV